MKQRREREQLENELEERRQTIKKQEGEIKELST